MELHKLTERALQISEKYDLLNQSKRGKTWTAQDIMSGFVGDVGDLSKLIMAVNGLRDITDKESRLAHELSDCLWSILILAEKHNIDLSKEFIKNMDELEIRIKNELSTD